MKTTFKTFAFVAMMTVFGATTAFANNNNHKYNNNKKTIKVEATTHKGNANGNITVKEYNNARHCNCKTCKDIVKAYEKQQKHNKKNNCTCNNCKKQNKNSKNNNYIAFNNNTHNQAGIVKAGGRR